jgi:hypothetical protein
MAIIHKATLTPTKLDLLATWLPGRAWYPADAAPALQRVGACRFDDPDGEVGVEMLVLRAGDDLLLHVPLTYRAAPLPDAEHWLVGTTVHSVLGERYVYDGVGDPVYLEALVAAIRTGGQQAEEFVETESGPQKRDTDLTVRGTGSDPEPVVSAAPVRFEDGDPAVVVTDESRLTIRRILSDHPADEHLVLTATWAGLAAPVVLATVE